MGIEFSKNWTRPLADRIAEVIERYESDVSFAGIEDQDLYYMPKLYLMEKVKPIDLEFVWRRLPNCYKEDFEMWKCLPCRDHYNVEEHMWCLFLENIPRKKNCLLCMYNIL